MIITSHSLSLAKIQQIVPNVLSFLGRKNWFLHQFERDFLFFFILGWRREKSLSSTFSFISDTKMRFWKVNLNVTFEITFIHCLSILKNKRYVLLKLFVNYCRKQQSCFTEALRKKAKESWRKVLMHYALQSMHKKLVLHNKLPQMKKVVLGENL